MNTSTTSHAFFSSPSDQSIHENALKIACKEKAATLELLKILIIVREQRIYAKQGYASMWEYVTKYLGYSEASASERLNALRLLSSVPEVETYLKSGSMPLTTAATIQRFIQKEEKEQRTLLPASLKSKIVHSLHALPKREVERKLLDFSRNPTTHLLPKSQERVLLTTNNASHINQVNQASQANAAWNSAGAASAASMTSVDTTKVSPKPEPMLYKELRFVIDAETILLLDQYRTLEGKEDLSLIFKKSLQTLLKTKQNKNRQLILPKKSPTQPKQHPHVKTPQPESQPLSHAQYPKALRSRYIPKHTRETVMNRANHQCEFAVNAAVNSGAPLTEHRCASQTKLQLDHIHPKALGGDNSPQNLRALCPSHNQLEAIRLLGHHTMRRYLGSDIWAAIIELRCVK